MSLGSASTSVVPCAEQATHEMRPLSPLGTKWGALVHAQLTPPSLETQSVMSLAAPSTMPSANEHSDCHHTAPVGPISAHVAPESAEP